MNAGTSFLHFDKLVLQASLLVLSLCGVALSLAVM